MTDITHVPLDKLIAWEGNARRSMSEEGLSELKSSIKAHGLLQSLVIKREGKKFAVVAGNRRLAALQGLAKENSIAADFAVPCQLVEDDKAAEVNLAENAVREAMHPADQFEAFRTLIDQGKSVADVAAAFGVTERIVEQRLKLARVSPVILQAYRDEKIDLETVMAYAVTDDTTAQERVFKKAGKHSAAYHIRNMLTEDEVDASDDRVKFVTLKAYEKAGGTTKRDLFSDDDNGIFLTDIALLDKLVEEKLAKAVSRLEKEGWKWVEARASFSWEDKSKFRQLRAEPPALSDKQAKEVEKLEAEYRKVEDAWTEADDDSDAPPRLEQIEKRLQKIEDSRGPAVFTPEQYAIAGAIVTIGDNGKSEIERGLVRPGDMPKASKSKGKSAAAGSGKADADEPGISDLSAGLIEDLTAQRSAALAAELMDAPITALAALVYTLTGDIFDNGTATDVISIDVKTMYYPDSMDNAPAIQKLNERHKSWAKLIPDDDDKRWKWCMKQSQENLTELLALCAALSVNAVQSKRTYGDRQPNALQLATELKLDMAKWYTPTAENYFNRVGKAQILEAIDDMKDEHKCGGMLDAAKAKKSECAEFAEHRVMKLMSEEGRTWLPPFLRQS